MVRKQIQYIAIAGNIGSGKTTLTELICKHYPWKACYDSIDNNPYLLDFYEDMPRWSFNLQIYFLQKRVEQLVKLLKEKKIFVQDRTLFEDAAIFASNLQEMGVLSKRDYDTYQDLFNMLKSFIKPPDIIIYLRSSVSNLVDQIQKRGRGYEENIRIDYLKKLNERYEKWIKNVSDSTVIIVDVDEIKFAEKRGDFGKVVQKIRKRIEYPILKKKF